MSVIAAAIAKWCDALVVVMVTTGMAVTFLAVMVSVLFGRKHK